MISVGSAVSSSELLTIRDTVHYIPEEHGCRCDECPLQHVRDSGRYVPPEIREGAELLVIAEAPGRVEEELNRPLVGPSGKENNRALQAAKTMRTKCSFSNALLCKPDGGNLQKYLAGLKVRNRRRKEKGEDPHLSPLECCRPRLMAEVKEARALLLLGAASRQSVLDGARASKREKGESGEVGLMSSRGFPAELEYAGRKIPMLSTVHPAYVLRFLGWRPLYQRDVDKAVRMVRGQLDWQPPEKILFPSPERLANILRALDENEKWVPAYDVETVPPEGLGLEPTTDRLRCIGIGNRELCTCVPFMSVHKNLEPARMAAWYSPAEEQRVRRILQEWFGDPTRVVCAHNEQYDRLVMRHQEPGIPILRRVFDTIIAHHVAHSEYPHGLNFLESQYTDNRQHKAVDHAHWPDDETLHDYCMDDVAVTSFCAAVLMGEKALREQKRAFQNDMWLSEFCREMHDVGIGFDVSERDRHYKEQTEFMEKHKAAFRQAAVEALPSNASQKTKGWVESINPGSHPQCARFFFEVCGIPLPSQNEKGSEVAYTEGGEPSTKKDALLNMVDRGVPPEIEEAVQCLIDYRSAQLIRGMFCTVEPMPDGRVRATHLPHTVVSGRLSCSKPNLYNIKGALRSMYCAQHGRKLVFSDKSQLELRVVAWLSGDEQLIDAFISGDRDVHTLNTSILLGKPYNEVTKKERKLGKTATYALNYGASPRKLWQTLKNFRTDEGERPYKGFKLKFCEGLHSRWWRAHSSIKQWHDDNLELWKKVGYYAEPLHGRRRYFINGVDEEAMQNMIIQSCSAADVNDAMQRVARRFPWNFAGTGTGLVGYNYDSLGMEVPADRALEIGAEMAELMSSKLGDMPLPVDLGVGDNWYDLKQYVKRDGEWVPEE